MQVPPCANSQERRILKSCNKKTLVSGKHTHTQTKVPVIMFRRLPYNESFQRKRALNFVNVYKQLVANFGYSIFK